jgi:hypothetical protein
MAADRERLERLERARKQQAAVRAAAGLPPLLPPRAIRVPVPPDADARAAAHAAHLERALCALADSALSRAPEAGSDAKTWLAEYAYGWDAPALRVTLEALRQRPYDKALRTNWLGGTIFPTATGLGVFSRAPHDPATLMGDIYECALASAGCVAGETHDARSLLTMGAGTLLEADALALYAALLGMAPTPTHYEPFVGRSFGALVVPAGAEILLTEQPLPSADEIHAALARAGPVSPDRLLRLPVVTSPDAVMHGRPSIGPEFSQLTAQKGGERRPLVDFFSDETIVEVKSRRTLTGPPVLHKDFPAWMRRQMCAEFVQLLASSIALGAPADGAVRPLDVIHYYVPYQAAPGAKAIVWPSKSGDRHRWMAWRMFVQPDARGELAGLVLACVAAFRNLVVVAQAEGADGMRAYAAAIEPVYTALVARLNRMDDPAWTEVCIVPLLLADGTVAAVDPQRHEGALSALAGMN